ncbi:MAG: PcfJ domain-containing protein, partial [Planctomycetes bacterium]|nr:PcfJ domain-containing protein [Planctomycetota bacterium]
PLVEALRGTALVRGFEHHEFWESVLRFFIRNPLLDRAHVGPVLDYLFAQRFAEERVADERGRVRAVPPPQPNLTMRGRNPDALLRQVGTWHRRLGHGFAPQQNVTWGPSGILPYRSVEKDRSGEVVRTDTVRELCSTAQLVAEGREMHHCVATYWQSCRGGRCSIWSVEVQEGDGLRQKLLTIEVRNSSREIVQARGKRNERPGSRARSVMMSWARAVELRIADWV